MKTIPLDVGLACFDEPPSPAIAEVAGPGKSLIPLQHDEDLPADVETSAIEAGENAGGYDPSQELEAEIEKVRKDLETQFASEREELLAQIKAANEQDRTLAAEAVRESVAQQFELVCNKLHQHLSHTLSSVLEPAVLQITLDQMAQHARDFLAANCKLTITGPEENLNAIKDRLQPVCDQIDWLPGAQQEVRIATGETVIETQLADWLNELVGAEQ